MSLRLNPRALEHATHLIRAGRYVYDERDAWNGHQPSRKEEEHYLRRHGPDAYGLWFLGVESDAREGTRERYALPYGDFSRVHRCAILAAAARAGEELEAAVAQLREQLERKNLADVG